jgi:hypothetical protein
MSYTCPYNIGHKYIIKPHLPIWKQDGAVVIERYTESFVDRNGNKAVLSMVSWKDKKCKGHESVHCVNWED